jgi:hypothetical protein
VNNYPRITDGETKGAKVNAPMRPSARSALLLSTDIVSLRGTSDKCPRSDIGASFDHLVGGDQQGLRNGQSKGFGSLEVDHLFQAGRLPDWQVRGAAPQ